MSAGSSRSKRRGRPDPDLFRRRYHGLHDAGFRVDRWHGDDLVVMRRKDVHVIVTRQVYLDVYIKEDGKCPSHHETASTVRAVLKIAQDKGVLCLTGE